MPTKCHKRLLKNRRQVLLATTAILLILSLPFGIALGAPNPSNPTVSMTVRAGVLDLVVKTLPAIDVCMDDSGTYATLRLDLTSLGSAEEADVWFEYGLNKNYGNTVGLQSVDTPAIYIIVIYNFHPDKTYNFRGAAKTVNGIAYGENLTFKDDPTTEWTVISLLPAVFATMFVVVFLAGLTAVSIRTDEWIIVVIAGPVVAIIGFLIIKELVNNAFGMR